MMGGKFVISLDFELLWGMRDIKNFENYRKNISGVHEVIPRLLETLNKHQIRATFATVGFLFFENKNELLNNLPNTLPNYKDKNLSPYISHLDIVGENFENDPYHYAPNLIKLIKKYPEQEIGTHTFSHYYSLEEGQSMDEFKADIQNAQKVANKHGINFTSLVFPRNQFNNDYLQICSDLGIICYRGNEQSWLYEARNGEKENFFRRSLRLLDAYVNISGHNCYPDEYLKSKYPVDIPSSRFLRPYSSNLKFLDSLRLLRIMTGMTYAAKNNLTYHLWWHPHNFGINQNENFNFLEKIFYHYETLHEKFNFQSHTMSGLANTFKNGK